MSSIVKRPLADVIRSCGEAWILDSSGDPHLAIDGVRKRLIDAAAEFAARYGNLEPMLSEGAIIDEFERNPHRVKAFIQALMSGSSPHMLVLVWRILSGAEIRHVEMRYDAEQSFYLQIQLGGGTNTGADTYLSNDIDDATLLRHLGILKMDDKPVFDGFYPLCV